MWGFCGDPCDNDSKQSREQKAVSKKENKNKTFYLCGFVPFLCKVGLVLINLI